MQQIAATEEMIAAVRSVRRIERLSAMRVAEKTFFSCLRSPNFTEEFSSDAERRNAAGQAAAAEVAFLFA